mgnify:CR=1 FL=1
MAENNSNAETSTTDAVYDITSNRGYRQATDDAHHLRAAEMATYVARQVLESLAKDMSAESCVALEDLCVALEDGMAEMRITKEKVAHAMQTWVSRRR